MGVTIYRHVGIRGEIPEVSLNCLLPGGCVEWYGLFPGCGGLSSRDGFAWRVVCFGGAGH